MSDKSDDLPARLGANLMLELDHAEMSALHWLIQTRDPRWTALLTAVFGLAQAIEELASAPAPDAVVNGGDHPPEAGVRRTLGMEIN